MGRRFLPKSFAGRLTVQMLLLIFLGLGLVSAFTIYLSVKTHTQYGFAKSKEEVSSLISDVDARLNNLMQDVQFLSTMPPVLGIIRASKGKGVDKEGGFTLQQWKDHLAVIFREMLTVRPEYLQIRYIGVENNGKEIVRVNRDGSTIFRTEEMQLQEKGKEAYFQEALEISSRRTYFSPLTLNREFGKVVVPEQLMLRAAVPIRDGTSDIFGLMVVNMKGDSLFGSLFNHRAPRRDVFIVDEEGRMLPALPNSTLLADEQSSGLIETDIEEKLKEVSGDRQVFTSLNRNHLFVATKIHYNPQNLKRYLGVVLATPEMAIFQKTKESIYRLSWIMGAFVLVSLGLCFFYIKHQIKPLRFLNQISDDLRKGKRIPLPSELHNREDEISDLITDFHQMADEIISKNALLEFQKNALDITALVSETDSRGVITYANKKFIDVSGYDSDELIGSTHQLINSGYHGPEFFEELWKTISSGKTWRGEIKNKSKQGDYYWVDSTIVPIRDRDGRLEKYISIRTDVTTRKEQEAQIRENAKAKSRFLAVMSHEIRTPLNGILGISDLLYGEQMTEKGQNFVRVLRDSGRVLRRIIDDILDFSKIEAGQLKIDTSPFDIRDLMQQVASLFYPAAKEKSISIDVNAEDLSYFVEGDVARVRQVLSNLVSNAIKFTESGVVSIQGRCLKADDGSDYSKVFQIDVVDEGVGIPEELKDNIFKSFSQADPSITRRFGGTGLGLAICRGICEALGGSIWFRGNLNGGTTFSFTFKARLAVRGLPPESSESIVEVDSNFSEDNPLRILVADDNPTNLFVTKHLLGNFGYEPDFAEDGLQAVKMLRESDYDVVLMDGHMPNLDGYSATHRIRNDKSIEKQPYIIAMTASVYQEDQDRCRKCGMNDFLAKPVEIDDLEAVLVRANAASRSNFGSDVSILNQVSSSTGQTISPRDGILSFDRLVEKFKGDRSPVDLILTKFVELLPPKMDALSLAIEKRSLDEIYFLAHTIKGGAVSIYANQVGENAADIEAMAKGNNMDGITTKFEDLKVLVNALLEEISSITATSREVA